MNPIEQVPSISQKLNEKNPQPALEGFEFSRDIALKHLDLKDLPESYLNRISDEVINNLYRGQSAIEFFTAPSHYGTPDGIVHSMLEVNMYAILTFSKPLCPEIKKELKTISEDYGPSKFKLMGSVDNIAIANISPDVLGRLLSIKSLQAITSS